MFRPIKDGGQREVARANKEESMAGNYPDFISKLEKNDPKLYESVTGIYDFSMSPGELDTRTKILISLALDALAGAGEGVRVLSKIARDMGVSGEQIAEALRLAYFVAGNPVLNAMKAAFEE